VEQLKKVIAVIAAESTVHQLNQPVIISDRKKIPDTCHSMNQPVTISDRKKIPDTCHSMKPSPHSSGCGLEVMTSNPGLKAKMFMLYF